MRGQRGFTLLEVMIATSVMAIGIVGALELFSGSLHLAGNADRQSHAVVLARALIDEEMWRDVLREDRRSGSEGDFSWTVVTHPIERELVGADEEAQGGLHDLDRGWGLWRIEAEVRWQAPLGEKSLSLVTARIAELDE